MFMSIVNFFKKLFKKEKGESENKVDVKVVPPVVVTNRGIGSDEEPTTIDNLGIQTTFNEDPLEELVEEGLIENVSD